MSEPWQERGIRVEVIYAESQKAVAKEYRLECGATLEDVLRLAAQSPEFSLLDVPSRPAGVFGRPAPPSQLLRDGDRVELYRTLPNDPKQARRARVQKARRRN